MPLPKYGDDSGLLVEYLYDRNGNLVREQDSNGNSTQYSYDVCGRRVASTHELTGETAFTYNEHDQITKIIQLGQSYEYQYDKMGRLILSNESDNPVKISYNVEGPYIGSAL